MTPAEMQAVIEGITEGVSEYVGELQKSLSAALDRIAVLEQRPVVHPKDGQDGAPGLSAYDLAVTHGFVGDEGAWLKSLRPKDGRDGVDAPPVNVDEVAKLAAALVPVPKDGQDGQPGKDGWSVTAEDVAPLISAEVTKAISALPVPKDGKDGQDGVGVDVMELKAYAAEQVKALVDAWPRPKDGTSVTVDDVAPIIAAEVTKAVEALPKPKDPVGIAGALIDRAGELVLTLSDGTTKSLGPVVGRDVDQSDVLKMITSEVQKFPTPKDGVDGKDGVGFDDLDAEYDDCGRMFLKFVRGETVKRFRVPGIVDRGVWREGTDYLKGDGVTWASSFWIAQADTRDKPGEGKTDWRLAVKKGGDGKPGIRGLDGKDGRAGRDFTPAPPGGRPY